MGSKVRTEHVDRLARSETVVFWLWTTAGRARQRTAAVRSFVPSVVPDLL